jgi:anti-sigma regulatory factor (Ser/Thr protein kinase)
LAIGLSGSLGRRVGHSPTSEYLTGDCSDAKMATTADVGFRHEALFYAGDDHFLCGTLPFITNALADEDAVLVVLSSQKIALLREALGQSAEEVHFEDMHQLGRNPARLIPAWRQFLDESAPAGGPVRGIGEPIWPGRSEAEMTECERHESLLNLAFDRGPSWRLLCPYDIDGLDEPVIEAARRNHPLISEDGVSCRSEHYIDHPGAPSLLDGALPAPTSLVEEVAFGSDQMSALRGSAARWAAAAQLGVDGVERLVLVVSELASNSVHYGGGGGTLRMWTEPETLVCEVLDAGRIQEPLVGRVRPTSDQHAGRGLWLVNQMCDLVQIRSTLTGTVVRFHMNLV